MKLNTHILDGIRFLSLAYYWWASIRATEERAWRAGGAEMRSIAERGQHKPRGVLRALKAKGALGKRGIDASRWKLVTGATGRGDSIQVVLAYEERPRISAMTGFPGGIAQGRVLIIVPGTNELTDWPTNMDGALEELEGFPGRFRRGFLRGALALHDLAAGLALREWGLNLYAGHVEVVAIGHSLGGALVGPLGAILALRYGHGSAPDWIRGLLTISAPRYCDADAAEKLTEFYPSPIGQRMSVGVDLVPHAVLRVLGRRHALDGVHIGSDGRLRPRGRIGAEIWGALREPGFQPLSHHSIDKTILPAVTRLAGNKAKE